MFLLIQWYLLPPLFYLYDVFVIHIKLVLWIKIHHICFSSHSHFEWLFFKCIHHKLSNLNSFCLFFLRINFAWKMTLPQTTYFKAMHIQYVFYFMQWEMEECILLYTLYIHIFSMLIYIKVAKICSCGLCLWCVFTFHKYVNNSITIYQLVIISVRIIQPGFYLIVSLHLSIKMV